MRPVSGISEIIKAEKAVAANFERNADKVAKKISDSWVQMIRLTDAIDSGDYLRAVNFHPVQGSGDLLEYLIDTSDNPAVDYEGFVEGGTKFMPGRFPAERAIEREEFVSTIEAFVEGQLDKS